MKVFITGISGFIGFHLARSLIDQGHVVSGIDNLNNDYDPELKKARQKALELDYVNVYNTCVSNRLLFDREIKSADVIVHLAAHAGIRRSLELPYDYINNNIVNTQRLIDAAIASNKPVVYASTSSVAGGQPLPFKEDGPVVHHKNPYAWSKYVNECQFKSAPISSIGFRFFTVYGPWGRPDMALFKFAKNIVAGDPIEVYNHGYMTRDFTYVQDIVNGVQLLIDKVLESDTKDIYNIGSGTSVDLKSFIRLIEKNLDRKADIMYMPMHPAEVQHTLSDLTKIKKLGYEPQTNIEEGIEKFISWFKSYYGVI